MREANFRTFTHLKPLNRGFNYITSSAQEVDGQNVV